METLQQANTHSNAKPKLLIDEISDATTEALFPLARTIKSCNFGSIFLKIREFGLYFTHADKYQSRLIARLCEYYDGTVTSKLTKTDDTENNISNISISALMYTDYAAFAKEIQAKLNLLMQTGFTRRCMVSFSQKTKSTFNSMTKQERQRLNNELQVCGEKLFNIFKKVNKGACYEITDEAYDIFNAYMDILTDKINDTDDVMVKKEIKSRQLKAIKLSGLYAILNHPNDLEVNKDDTIQAILSVERMSEHFAKFYFFKPYIKDKYEDIYKWFRDREGQTFKKTELTKKYYQDFGYSRANFAKAFEQIMKGVKELAELDEYIFEEKKIKPNGLEYKLYKPVVKPLSTFAKPLDVIVNSDDSVKEQSNNPF